MEGMKPITTSSGDETITYFITIRDLLKDSNQYFQNRIESKTNTCTYEDLDNLEYLYERSTDVLRIINEIIEKFNKEPQKMKLDHKTDNDELSEIEENTSYLDMSMRKYESYELSNPTENLNRNDYVDVIGKSSKESNGDDEDDDDDGDNNIYDSCMVERNIRDKKATESTIQNFDITSKNNNNDKQDCPFNGLPAAHLTIMHSPKVGWLTMHLRRKRFIHHLSVHFKRKYYTGLVAKQTKQDYYEWWLLMYAGGTSDLKPTICLPINQFLTFADHSKIRKHDEKQQKETKRNPCKFELNEKTTKKDSKSYCCIAETPAHCEQWINLLKQLGNGKPYVGYSFTSTAQIRKLPMLPLNTKNTDIDRLTGNIDTVDTNGACSTQPNISDHTFDLCNYSEGVYEEPEEYYKNVPSSTSRVPKLPAKQISQSTASTIRINDISSIYDTPKKQIRKSDEAKHFDLISAHTENNIIKSKLVTSESNRLKIDDEIRSKFSTQLKEQSQKLLSSSGQKASDEEIIRNSAFPTTDGTSNKYQLNVMRKWLFSNHLAKLRKSSGSTTEGITQQRPNQQQQKTNAIVPSQKRAFSVQPKGTKVHMIINQLEANGQLTLLSGGTSSNKCSSLMSS